MKKVRRPSPTANATDDESLIAFIADHLPVCIGYVDASRRYRYVNARYQELFDRPLNTILGRTVAEVVGLHNYRAVEPYISNALKGEPSEFDFSARYPRLGLRHAHFKYLPHKLEDGVVAGYFVLVIDTTELREMRQTLERQNAKLLRTQRELERLAHYDPLTGLGNRRLFQRQLDHALSLSRRRGHSIGLLLIDLDGFKSVNDSAGHEAGDAVLKEVAKRLMDVCRSADTIARLGGDEFVVLMETGATVEGAEMLAGRIEDSLLRPIRHDRSSLRVGVSIGVTVADPSAVEAGDILRAADAAMYRAKAAGGGRRASLA